MSWDFREHKRNVHEIRIEQDALIKQNILLISDVHFDNPHCNRKLLKKHLDEAIELNAAIVVAGDLFCLMQGTADPRKGRGKNHIRPEHDVPNYFDAVVETAVEWWQPYANNLVLVGQGNHESAILKHNDIDVIERFASQLRANGGVTQAGGYGGWLKVMLKSYGHSRSNIIYYHHGYGGGSATTRATNQFARFQQMARADVYISGHTHFKESFPLRIAELTKTNRERVIDLHCLRLGTYKDEFTGANGRGYHIEKGRTPRSLGGYWMEFELTPGKHFNRSVREAN